MKLQTEIQEKINKYITLYRCNIIENGEKIGYIDGWIVDTKNLDEAFYQIRADYIYSWEDTLKELNLDGAKIFIFKNYRIFDEHQFKEKGIEAGAPHQDWAVSMGCKYMIGYPHPVYDDPETYKDKEKLEKDKEFMSRYYIDYHTYKGKWFKLENSENIMKVIS